MSAPTGLWCADGERGMFERRPKKHEGSDACARCGGVAWRHSVFAPEPRR